MSKIVALVVIVLLAGCAQAPSQPVLVDHTVTLPPQRIPVITPCLKREDVPPPPPSYMLPGARQDPEKREIAAAIDLKSADEYVVKTQSIMWGCVEMLEATEKEKQK